MEFDKYKKPYTIPKLRIPTETKNNKKVPSVKAGKDWYIYFYYTTEDGVRKKIMKRHGINRFKTVSERKLAGQNIISAYLDLLEKGYNPFKRIKHENGIVQSFDEDKRYTLREALQLALDDKHQTLKSKSYRDYKFRLIRFIKWSEKVEVIEDEITSITKKHIISFLDTLTDLSGTSVNNYRRVLSSVFGTLSKRGIITHNISKELPTVVSRPKKNIPFSAKEMEKISFYLKQHDPYLYEYIKFIFYGFLRPIEVSRLQTKDIDLENNIYRVETKQQEFKTKVIVPQLKAFLESQILSKELNIFLFSNSNKPMFSETLPEARYKFMSERFKKVKEALGFSSMYGFYSFRHTGAVDLYNHFKKGGFMDNEIIIKMLPITGHSNESSLRKYLREIDANLPTGYGSNFTINF